MAIISILLVFGAEHILGDAERVREPAWFRVYSSGLARIARAWRGWDGWPGALITLGLPILALVLLQALLRRLDLDLIAVLVGLVVLFFSLGPKRLGEQAHAFMARAEDGGDGGLDLAGAILGRRPDDLGRASAALRDLLLEQSGERLFAVLFWFVVLGPVGALLVRLAVFAREIRQGTGFADFAARLAGILAWIPSRLLALTYGLVGSLDHSLEGWKAWRESGADPVLDAGRSFLREVGRGALQVAGDATEQDEPDAVAAALQLYHRALAVWLILLALLTLAGWLT